MVIAVGDARVYKFPQSSIAVEIHNDHAEVLVLPERRKFIVRLQPQTLKAMQATYPEHTHRQLLSTFVIKALEDGFLPTNEEI
jgi:hypothetical protein